MGTENRDQGSQLHVLHRDTILGSGDADKIVKLFELQHLIVKNIIEENNVAIKDLLTKHSGWNFLFHCATVEEDLLVTPLFGIM